MLVATIWFVFYAMAVLRVVIEPAVYPAATTFSDDANTTETTATWK